MKTLLSQLSLEEKVGQLFIIGFVGQQPAPSVSKFIEVANIGSVILFARNVENEGQVIQLTNSIHRLGRITPLICADQEGGTVVQFRELAATVISHMGLAATGNPENAFLAGGLIGRDMDVLGLDGVLAPGLDVNINEDNPIIGIRSFSDDPDMVAAFGKRFAAGLTSQNIANCAKHFPGHGSTTEDSHLELPVSRLEGEAFNRLSLHPFAEAVKAGIDCVLSAHIRYSDQDGEAGTFSPYLLTELLRRQWGFPGVILTDCLEMKAMQDNYTPRQIVLKAIGAGADLLTVSRNFELQREMVNILLGCVKSGEITEKRIDESVLRILDLKNRLGLMGERKQRSIKQAKINLRRFREKEQDLADQSITLLRNHHDLIPLDRKKKILILEWEKVTATFPTVVSKKVSMLQRAAGRHFSQFEISIFGFESSISKSLTKKIMDSHYVIAALFSRNPEIGQRHLKILRQLIALREDTIVVALGNPYDIKWLPAIKNYLVSYGFRDIQIEAIFRILTGEVHPRGTLPVQIKGLFRRGDGIIR
jgi:beta-N-acetylhexosaminidase